MFSVIASARLNWFYGKFGRKAALSSGTILCVVSLGSMLLLNENCGWVMYIIAAFVGIILDLFRCIADYGAINRHKFHF